jgi:hypothetical protein
MRKYIKIYTAVILLVGLVSVSALLLARKSSAEIAQVSPQDEATGVNRNVKIQVTFWESKSNCVFESGSDFALVFTEHGSSTQIPGTGSYNDDTHTYTYDPTDYLAANTLHDVDFDFRYISANLSNGCQWDIYDDLTWSFTTGTSTAVILSDFSAVAVDDPDGDFVNAEVNWETAIEINTVGFNVLRSRYANSSSTWEQVNDQPIIPENIGGVMGGSYSLTDTSNLIPGKTYYYMLEELEVGEIKIHYGPVEISSERDEVMPWIFPW